MPPRRSNLPLLLGAMLSLVVHLGAIPAFSLLKLAAPPQPTTPEELVKETTEEKAHEAQAVQEPKPAESPEEKPSKSTEAPREKIVLQASPSKEIAAPTAPRPAARPREMIDPLKPKPTGKEPARVPDENEVKLGRDNGLPIATVAWIAYDDFQTLIARKARTEQPALQKNANPVPVGPIAFDAADAAASEKRNNGDDAGPAGRLKVEGNGKPRNPGANDAGNHTAAAVVPDVKPAPALTTPPVAMPTAPPVVKPPEPRVAAATPTRVEPPPTPKPQAKPAPPEPALPRPSTEQLAAAIPWPPATPTIELPKPTPPAPATPQPQPAPKPAMPPSPPVPTPATPPPPAPSPAPTVVVPGVVEPAKEQLKPTGPDAPKPAPADGKGMGGDAKSEPGAPNANNNPGGVASGDGNKKADLPQTAAPRSDRESPPSSLTDGGAKLRPGAVLTGDGIEIKTAVPRLSAVAQASVIPTNPQVKVVFDKSGDVIDAAILTSSGSANFDGPILASLYKWKAAGRKLKEVQGNLTLKITIILVD